MTPPVASASSTRRARGGDSPYGRAKLLLSREPGSTQSGTPGSAGTSPSQRRIPLLCKDIVIGSTQCDWSWAAHCRTRDRQFQKCTKDFLDSKHIWWRINLQSVRPDWLVPDYVVKFRVPKGTIWAVYPQTARAQTALNFKKPSTSWKDVGNFTEITIVAGGGARKAAGYGRSNALEYANELRVKYRP